MHAKRGFTLLEVLLTMAVISVLAIVVVLILNPSYLFTQARDANRAANLTTLDKAITLYYSSAIANPATLFMGSSSVIYLSIPDPSATTTAGTNCSGIGLDSPGVTIYHCPASSTYLKTDGTGWIPINFNSYPGGSPISSLPVDPVNTTSSGEYYRYAASGTLYAIAGIPQTIKYASDTADFLKGTSALLLPGNIWVPDTGNDRIEEFSGTGAYESKFGTPGAGNGNLNFPVSVAVDANGNEWVVDYYNNRIEEFSPTGAYVSKITSPGSGYGSFNNLQGIIIDGAGNIWVADSNNARIIEFSPSGTFMSKISISRPGDKIYPEPTCIAIDGAGNIWVTDYQNSSVKEFSPSGTYISQFGGSGNATLNGPVGLAIDVFGNLWVTDYQNNRIEEFSPNGTYISQFGGSGNATLNGPTGLAIDALGNVWVVDSGNNRIEEFSENGLYEYKISSAGAGDGQLTNPAFFTIH